MASSSLHFDIYSSLPCREFHMKHRHRGHPISTSTSSTTRRLLLVFAALALSLLFFEAVRKEDARAELPVVRLSLAEERRPDGVFVTWIHSLSHQDSLRKLVGSMHFWDPEIAVKLYLCIPNVTAAVQQDNEFIGEIMTWRHVEVFSFPDLVEIDDGGRKGFLPSEIMRRVADHARSKFDNIIFVPFNSELHFSADELFRKLENGVEFALSSQASECDRPVVVGIKRHQGSIIGPSKDPFSHANSLKCLSLAQFAISTETEIVHSGDSIRLISQDTNAVVVADLSSGLVQLLPEPEANSHISTSLRIQAQSTPDLIDTHHIGTHHHDDSPLMAKGIHVGDPVHFHAFRFASFFINEDKRVSFVQQQSLSEAIFRFENLQSSSSHSESIKFGSRFKIAVLRKDADFELMGYLSVDSKNYLVVANQSIYFMVGNIGDNMANFIDVKKSDSLMRLMISNVGSIGVKGNAANHVHSLEDLQNRLANRDQTQNTSIKIGLLIPVLSSPGDYDFMDVPFFQVFLPSFLSTIRKRDDPAQVVEFVVYFGCDPGDSLYDNPTRRSELNQKFATVTAGYPMELQVHVFEGMKGAPAWIWSALADVAYFDNCDYFYQVNDDLRFSGANWAEKFVGRLLNNPLHPNLGCVGPVDGGNGDTMTQSFVHRTHLEIFGYYYPPAFRNWYSDDWITSVYNAFKSTFWLREVRVLNTNVKDTRYEIDHSAEKILSAELKTGEHLVTSWLKSHEQVQ